MSGKTAVLSFLVVCVFLAILVLNQVMSLKVSGLIFAIALVLFGLFSRGFRK